MNSLEKYKKIFMDSFNIDNTKLEGLEYNKLTEWDSIGHMTLIAAIEEVPNILKNIWGIFSGCFSKTLKNILSKN